MSFAKLEAHARKLLREQRALRTLESLEGVAAEQALHHLREVRRLLVASAASAEVAEHAVVAGYYLARAQDWLRLRSPHSLTLRDSLPGLEAAERRERIGSSNRRREKTIDPARYDALLARRKSQEQIAAVLGCSRVTLRKWRKTHQR